MPLAPKYRYAGDPTPMITMCKAAIPKLRSEATMRSSRAPFKRNYLVDRSTAQRPA
jgi:hypothetical protein